MEGKIITGKQADGITGFKMRVSGRDVLVRFSGSGEPDVKGKVRDILTEAYEERFQREVSAYARGT